MENTGPFFPGVHFTPLYNYRPSDTVRRTVLISIYNTILTILVFMQDRVHVVYGVQLTLHSPSLAPHRAHHTIGLLRRLRSIDLLNTTR